MVCQHWRDLSDSPSGYRSSYSISYLVPFIMTQVVDVGKVCKSGPSGVVDDDVQPAEFLNGFLDESNAVGSDSNVLPHRLDS